MTSAIKIDDSTGYSVAYPIPGRDNDSQGFRTNFSVIKDGLETAASEISILQANKADLVEQSLFTNNTPSYSTETGAIVVVGGMGIGGDVYIGGYLTVNGGSALTSSTTITSTNSDVLLSGTFGEPYFTLAPTIGGVHTWRGRNIFSPGAAYDHSNTLTNVFVSTTASVLDLIGLHVRLTSAGSALKLDLQSANQRYISFVAGSGQTELGSLRLDSGGDRVVFYNTFTCADGLVVENGTSISGGLNVSGGGAVITGGITLPDSTTVATTSTTGIVGQIKWDADYIYVCVGTNQWKRAALLSW